MSRLVRTELLKQRTTLTFVAAFTAVVAAAALITLAICTLSGKEGNDPLGPESLLHIIAAPTSVITLISLMLGVVGMAGEHRHKTITTTLLATPRRRDVVVAKLVTHALIGAVMAAVSLAVSLAIGVPWLLSSDIAVHLDGEAAAIALGVVASTALYAALGVAVGALIRNQTAAVTVLLVWLLAVEGIVTDIFVRSSFVDWLPSAAGRALVHVGSGGDQLAPLAGGAVFLAYVAALALAGMRFTVSRDIT